MAVLPKGCKGCTYEKSCEIDGTQRGSEDCVDTLEDDSLFDYDDEEDDDAA